MWRALAVTVVLAGSAKATAASQGDWFASLYTGEGVELRHDERIFTLFAIFNATGFDRGPVARLEPVPKLSYHPVRAAVRARVLSGDPELRAAADAFFDAHPAPMKKYLAWAAQSDSPPFASGTRAKDLAELKGFEQVMARAWAGWHLDELSSQFQGDYRKTLKTYLPVIDGPLARARELLQRPESSEVVLVVNLLDAQGEVRAVPGDGNQVFLIAGPADHPNVEGAVREYARLAIESSVTRVTARWQGGAQALREAQQAGATEQTVADWATAVLSRALALRAVEAPDEAYEAAAAKGAFGIKEVSRLFDGAKGLEGVINDALQKLETRRPVKK